MTQSQSQTIKITGNVEVVRKDIFGNEIGRSRSHNLVVTTGLDLFVVLLSVSTQALIPKKFMLGSGTTATASTDTALQTSAYNFDLAGTTARSAGLSFVGTLAATDAHGLTFSEVGLFTSSSSLVARALITPFTKSTDLGSQTVETFTWAMDFTAIST